jgi:hypothetical protein
VAEVFVYYGALDGTFLDRHPAELGFDAGDREGDDAHHHETWRIAKVLEGATEQFVDFPVDLLTFRAAVVDVLAAGAEFTRFGTDCTLIVGGRHGVVSYGSAGMIG